MHFGITLSQDPALAADDSLARVSTLDSEERITWLGPHTIALLRRHNLVRSLVKALLIERAVADVELTEQERAEAVASTREREGLSDAHRLAQLYAFSGFGEADVERQLLLPMLRARHCRRCFGHLAETTFLRQKGSLDKVVYSFIRVSDPHLALELYHRIAAGEANFADVAHQYSEGPERHSWGLVGPRPLNQAHPALAERLRTAQPGVVQRPFRTSDTWLVTRLNQLLPARLNEATIQKICEQLFNNWLDEQVTAFFTGNQADGTDKLSTQQLE